MLGVFINGMEMPRVCAECFMDPPCCKSLNGDTNIWKERHPDCPLVEVKEPHGRLIDADKLIEKYGEWYTEEGTESGYIGTMKNLLKDAPTVIEAEGREE